MQLNCLFRWWILKSDVSWNVETMTLVWSQMMDSEPRYQLECWEKKNSGMISDDEFWSQISAGMLKKNYSGMIFRREIQDDHVTEPIQCEANVSLNLACLPSCPVVIFSRRWWSGRLQLQNNVQCSFSVIPLCNVPNCGLEFACTVGSVYGIVIEDLVVCHCSHALLCKSIFIFCVHLNNTWKQFVLVLLVLCCLCS